MFRYSDFSNAEISFKPSGHLTLVKIKNISLKSGEIIFDEIGITADCHQYPGRECKNGIL